MPNPGKPITFNGETMTVAAWARRLGIKRVKCHAEYHLAFRRNRISTKEE